MRSGLEYASAIWDPPHKSNARKKLESVQRKAARFVTGNPQKRHQDHLPDRDYDYVSVASRRADRRLGMAKSGVSPQVCKMHTRVQDQDLLL